MSMQSYRYALKYDYFQLSSLFRFNDKTPQNVFKEKNLLK